MQQEESQEEESLSWCQVRQRPLQCCSNELRPFLKTPDLKESCSRWSPGYVHPVYFRENKQYTHLKDAIPCLCNSHMPRPPGWKCPLTLTTLHSHSRKISNTPESSILRWKICGDPHGNIWISKALIPRDFSSLKKCKERVQNPLLPLIWLRTSSVIKSPIWVRKIPLAGEPTGQNLEESSQVQFTQKQS